MTSGHRHYSSYVWVARFSSWAFSVVLSQSQVRSLQASLGRTLWILKGVLFRSACLFLCAGLSSLTLGSISSSCLGVKNTRLCLPISGICQALPQCLLPELLPGNSLKPIKWRNHRPDLIWFPSPRDYCFCLRSSSYCFAIYKCFSYLGGSVNLASVSPSWKQKSFFF